MLNRGDGTFEPRRVYLSARDVDVALGDLNGDGKPELVIVNGYLPSDGRVSVLVNAGDGTFEIRRDYQTTYPEVVAIGDLNGDGKADVATADWQQTVSVLLNRGDGSLGPEGEYDCRCGNLDAEAFAIAIADPNSDGKPDLVAEWETPDPQDSNTFLTKGSVLLNKGLGSFSPGRRYEIPYRSPLAIVDLNGDGKPDIAAPGEGLSVLLNKGAGRFEPGLNYRFGGDALATANVDLNGDGRQDYAAALDKPRHNVAVRLNAPGLCNVQWVAGGSEGMTVAAAKQRLGRANCRVGKVTRAYSNDFARGRVISQRPRFGAVLPGGAKVNLVISRGKKRR
jgi:hypothetical protein